MKASSLNRHAMLTSSYNIDVQRMETPLATRSMVNHPNNSLAIERECFLSTQIPMGNLYFPWESVKLVLSPPKYPYTTKKIYGQLTFSIFVISPVVSYKLGFVSPPSKYSANSGFMG
jgi:hypothetical protein